jgi:hypothetical protein
MPRVECPQCHAAAAFAFSKPYCPRCGWNREQAANQLGRIVRHMPWVFLVLLGAPVLWQGGRNQNWALAALTAAVLGLPFLIAYLSARTTLQRMLAGSTAATRPGEEAIARTEAADEAYRVLLALPRPRPVCLSRRGKFYTVLIRAAFGCFEAILLPQLYRQWERARSGGSLPLQSWFPVLAAAFLVFVLMGFLRGWARDRRLLATGEVTMAHVTRQWSMRNSSSIAYQFQDTEGRKVEAQGPDYTRTLYEGMSVPVFFNANNPKVQVALCTSFFEVVLPGTR